MRHKNVIWAIFIFIIVTASFGCSGTISPLAPESAITKDISSFGESRTNLWGYYDLYFDLENKTVEAVASRSVEFTANVVTFINPKGPAGLVFKINGTPTGPGYVDVDIDVTIVHPLNLEAYDGYDVKGIFIANGSAGLDYGNNLRYAEKGIDQYLTNADGYTRWFNPDEFSLPGILGYTPGVFASNNYTGNATLNPYKYFAQGLSANGDIWNYLTTTSSNAGYFIHGTSNTRNYLLRFPVPNPNVKYGYAIAANWAGEAPEFHPDHSVETPAVKASVTPHLFYVDDSLKGGNLILDVDIFAWDIFPSTVTIESTVTSSPYTLDLDSEIPIGGGENYSTWHMEIAADSLTSSAGNEFWVIAEYSDYGYYGPFTPSGGAPEEALAAFFRFDLPVATEPYNYDPVCDLQYDGTFPSTTFLTTVPVSFDASGSYDPDIDDTLTFEWDFDGDQNYGETPDDDYTGTETNPTHVFSIPVNTTVRVKVTDEYGAYKVCSLPVAITSSSCGTMSVPGGSTTDNFVNTPVMYRFGNQPTRAASNKRIITSGSSQAYFAAVIPNSTTFEWNTNNSYNINSIAISSQDRIYYVDSQYTNRIKYRDFTNMIGFTGMTLFGTTIPAGWNIFRVSIDENDNPIVLCYNPLDLADVAIFHWNGTDWGTVIDIDAALSPDFGNSYTLIHDFDYNPYGQGTYIFTERNSFPGMIVVGKDGMQVFKNLNVTNSLATGTQYPGVYIDLDSEICRMLFMTGNYGASASPGYFVRFNPIYGEKSATGTISGTPYIPGDGRGCVIVEGSSAYYYASCYTGGRWARVLMPGW